MSDLLQGTKVTKSWPFRISPVWSNLVESSSLTTVITTTSWRPARHRKAKISTIRYCRWNPPSPLSLPVLPEFSCFIFIWSRPLISRVLVAERSHSGHCYLSAVGQQQTSHDHPRLHHPGAKGFPPQPSWGQVRQPALCSQQGGFTRPYWSKYERTAPCSDQGQRCVKALHTFGNMCNRVSVKTTEVLPLSGGHRAVSRLR